MKKIVIGILAHVDSGKTTLSESLLYHAGIIRKLGRVDHGDSVLDNEITERKRGITIFSKQAIIQHNNVYMTLLDTPGHADFGAEAERSLDVLDAAILVISASEGIQSHTVTLWRLLEHHNVPVFVFINKTDLIHKAHDELINEFSENFGDGFADFTAADNDNIAICDEALLNDYVKTGKLSLELIQDAVMHRRLFPCFSGSALKLDGTAEFLDELLKYALSKDARSSFGAKVYRISRDSQGQRLTHMKITGGSLAVKNTVGNEKINEIRFYTGGKYTTADIAEAGTVCAVTGLELSYPGMGIGCERDMSEALLEPVMTYTVIIEDSTLPHVVLEKLKLLEEELPELNVVRIEALQEIHIQTMGAVQLEVIEALMSERFGIRISFGQGNILYKETIAASVEGVGHFEPLRHYAEVHLLMEPGERGSGISISADCSTDYGDISRQRVILSHIAEKVHSGILTGSPLTDTKITLIAWRASNVHTEGGDFRQATLRAVRQGLSEAGCILLEPWYSFTATLPSESIGRLINDIQQLGGSTDAPEISGAQAIVRGRAPLNGMQDYSTTLKSYTKGSGNIVIVNDGYDICHNADEVIAAFNYDPERDTENPSSSIFCEHGSGVTVPWQEVKSRMHIESAWRQASKAPAGDGCAGAGFDAGAGAAKNTLHDISSEEEDKQLQAIFEKTFGHSKKAGLHKAPKYLMPNNSENTHSAKPYRGRENPYKEDYIIVDGYNLIYAWKELKELSEQDFGAAREKLIGILANYRAFIGCHMLIVFDAYKVKNGMGSIEKVHDIDVVYTREAQTADAYIEKVSYEISKAYRVRVVTSDRMEQLIILGNGALRVSSRAFIEEISSVENEIRDFL